MSSETLNQKVVNQIEYYFGDVNLPKDKFLRDLVGKEDGWVPITTLITFKRLKQMAENEENVVKALEEVKSDLVELNESKDKIRRSVALPNQDNESKLEYKLKTIHIKGFPVEGTTLDDCINFCSQYGKVQSVQMKKLVKEKTFKGCIFVIFQDVESANKCLSSNDKFKDEIELGLRENKEQYFQRKKGNRKSKKDKLVKLENVEAEETNENNEEDDDKEMTDKDANTEADKEADKEEPEEEEELKYEKGCCVKLLNVPDGTHYRQIRPQLTEYGNVQYVDLMPETKSGLVRFATKEDADKALKAFAYTETNGTTNGNTNGVKQEEKVSDENAEKQDENVDASKDDKKETDVEVEKEKITDEQNGEVDISKLQKIKIENLVLSYQVLEGEEEAEYWKTVHKLKSDNIKKGPSNKMKKQNYRKNFNKKGAKFGKRKNHRDGNDRFAKKVKSEN